jgi:WD40 repeat protein
VAKLFAGGLETWDQLSALLLTAFGASLTTGPHIHRGEQLVATVQGLCQGANPDWSIPQVLLKGHGDRTWRSLSDPDLLRSELHGFLINTAASTNGPFKTDLIGFADQIKQRLAGERQPWLERLWPNTTDLVPTVEHDAQVTALEVMDSRWIISGDRLGRLIVWDWQHASPRSHQQHQGEVRAVKTFTYDNRRWIASTGDDGTVRLRQLAGADGAPDSRTQPRPHAGRGFALAVLQDGEHLHILSAGEEGLLYDWLPWESGKPVRAHREHRGNVRFLEAFYLDGRCHIASAGDDGRIVVWRIDPSGELTLAQALDGWEQPVTALHCNSNLILWGDGLGRVFSAKASKYMELASRRDHTQAVTALRIQGETAHSAGKDGRVVHWKWRSNDSAGAFPRRGAPVSCLEISDGAPTYSTDDGIVMKSHDLWGWHPGGVRFMKVLPGDPEQRFVTAGERLVRVARPERRVPNHLGHRGRVTSLAAGNGFFVSGGQDGSVLLFERVHNSSTWEPLHHWPTHHDGKVSFLQVCGTADEPLIVTAGHDGKMCIWGGVPNALKLLDVWSGAPIKGLWTGRKDVVWAAADGFVYRSRLPELRKELSRWPGMRDATAFDVLEQQETLYIVVASSREVVFPLLSGTVGNPRPMASGIRAIHWLDPNQLAVATANGLMTSSVSSRIATPISDSARGQSPLARSPGRTRLAWGMSFGKVGSLDVQARTVSPPADFHLGGGRVIALQFADETILVSASHDGVIKFGKFEQTGLQVLGGCPAGGQVSAIAVRDLEVFAGLVDGSVVVLQMNLPKAAPSP